MPRVPTYDNFQVTPNTLPQNQLQGGQYTPVRDIAGRQAQQTGQTIQQLGGDAGRAALAIQQEANQLRFDDAANQAKEIALKLQFDKDVGYANLRGIDALKRPDGKALSDEYGESLQKQLEQIGGTLGNDAQRQAFSAFTSELRTRFTGQVMAHEAGEFKNYGLSVAEGIQSTAMRDIALNWNNPDATADAIHRIRAETYRQAQLLGKSAEWQEARVRELTSGAHKLAAVTALENGDPDYAAAYLKKYSGEMEAPDIVVVRGHVVGAQDMRTAGAAAGNVWSKNYGRINPNQFDRLWSGLLRQESGGRQTDSGGNPVTSSAGAVGIAQVMPDTAKYVAKKNGIPWDENRYKTDAAYNENLGKLYFQEQLQDFGGDVAKALAAYNAGPGSASSGRGVRGAVAKAEKAGRPDDWLSFMPAETRNYVPSILGRMDRSEGVVRKPTLAELKSELRQDPAIANNPNRLKLADAALEKQFKDNQAATKQTEEENKAAVFQALEQNGGDFSQLSPQQIALIPAGERDTFIDYAKKIADGAGVRTDPALYYQLTIDPKTLRDVNLMSLKDKIAPDDLRSFMKQQAMLRENKNDDYTAVQSNTQYVTSLFKQIGMDKDVEKQAAFYKAMQAEVIDKERQLNRKLTADEYRKTADSMFLKYDLNDGIVFDTKAYGFEVKNNPALLENNKNAEIVIPPDEYEQIRLALQRNKKPISNEIIQQLYKAKHGL